MRIVAIVAVFFAFFFLFPAAGPALADPPDDMFLIAQQDKAAPTNADQEDEDEYDEDEDEEETVEIADPLYYFNKGMYHFNDKLYFWVLKPAAQGYKFVVPIEIRTCVKNFFYNLRFPIRFVNCLLQGKGKKATAEFTRFFLNTTAGLAGIADVVSSNYPSLNPSPEDLGQTLGHWGVGNGCYIVLPVFGPYTFRDTARFIDGYFLDPVSWLRYTDAEWWVPYAIVAYDRFNSISFQIGDYEALKEAAFDPYVSIRDAYVQHRKKLVAE